MDHPTSNRHLFKRLAILSAWCLTLYNGTSSTNSSYSKFHLCDVFFFSSTGAIFSNGKCKNIILFHSSGDVRKDVGQKHGISKKTHNNQKQRSYYLRDPKLSSRSKTFCSQMTTKFIQPYIEFSCFWFVHSKIWV